MIGIGDERTARDTRRLPFGHGEVLPGWFRSGSILLASLLMIACVAPGSEGEHEITPGTPTAVTATVEVEPHLRVHLSWEYDGAPVERFRILRSEDREAMQLLAFDFFQPPARGSWRPMSVSSTDTTYVDPVVLPGRTYYYRIIAVRNDVEGTPSEVLAVKLNEDAPEVEVITPEPDYGTGDPSLTPLAVDGLGGPLPPALCGRGNVVSLVSADPHPQTPLPSRTTRDFVFEIDYAFMEPVPLSLRIPDGEGGMHASPRVTLGPGCGRQSLVVSGVYTGRAERLPVSLAEPLPGAYWLRLLTTYRVADQPYLEVIGVSQAPNTILEPDEDGAYQISWSIAWDFFGREYPEQTKLVFADPLDIFERSALNLDPDGGSATYTQTVPADPLPACTAGTVNAYVGVENEQSSLVTALSWFIMGEDGLQISHPPASFALAPEDEPVTGSFEVTGCVAQEGEEYLRFSSDVPWLFPQAETVAVGALPVAVTFTVDAFDLPLGEYTGAVTVESVGDSVAPVHHDVSLLVRELPAPYDVEERSVDWYDDAVTDAESSQSAIGPMVTDQLKTLSVPFPISLYGNSTTQITISNNGFLSLEEIGWAHWSTSSLPHTAFAYQLALNWADLSNDADADIRYAAVGEEPDRKFVLTYYGVGRFSAGDYPSTFQVVFFEGEDRFLVQYRDMETTGLGGVNLGDGETATTWDPQPETAYMLSRE